MQNWGQRVAEGSSYLRTSSWFLSCADGSFPSLPPSPACLGLTQKSPGRESVSEVLEVLMAASWDLVPN